MSCKFESRLPADERPTAAANRQRDSVDAEILPVEANWLPRIVRTKDVGGKTPSKTKGSQMFNKFLIASAATVMAASLISGTALAAAPNSSGQQKSQRAEKKYCLSYDNVVGSRLTRAECRTKAQWLREGIDINQMIKG
jgi:hypothetical protein